MRNYPANVIPVCGSSRTPQNVTESFASTKNEVVLTVWKKSLLFNCDGFTVFDSNGNLVFRVDNYVPGGDGEIVLMDAFGRSLLTIRRKRQGLLRKWVVYKGETTVSPLFLLMKHMTFLNTKSVAYVTAAGSLKKYDTSSSRRNVSYKIEGSYAQRCCKVYDDTRYCLVDIRRKETKGGVCHGGDVFELVMQLPLIDPANAMAIVIILDQMFGRSRRFHT